MNEIAITVHSATTATSSSDPGAALTVKGGVAIAKDVYVGGLLSFASIQTTSGAFQMNTSTLALSSSDGYFMIECVFAGATTITLPLASAVPGKQYYIIKKTTAGFTLAINTSGSDTVDGVDTSITALSAPNNRIKLCSNGISTWYSG